MPAVPCRLAPPAALALVAAVAACSGALSARAPDAPVDAPPPEYTHAGSPVRGGYGPDPDVSLTVPEAEAAQIARSRLAAGGRPRPSGALTLAARLLARRAAEGAADPLGRTAVRDALALAGSCDPAPAAFLARASPAGLRDALRQSLAVGRATHVGVGVVEAGGALVAVVLSAERRVRLDPFPREVPVGGAAVLSGALGAGLRAPRVFVTLPSLAVEEVDTTGAATFRARVPLRSPGRYLVEVVAESAAGPTVVALLPIAAGGASIEGPPEADGSDPADPAEAEARVVAALNALRARRGLTPLASSPALAAVARRHSAAMREAGKVAHVVPGSPGPDERLTRAQIPFVRVLENVAAARTAMTAHQQAADSPAHLRNMLEPGVTRVGVGMARGTLPSGDPYVYVTEILIDPGEDAEAIPQTPEARVRAALWGERARLGLPPLTSDVALDELAREGATELRRRDAAEVPDLGGRALGLGPRRALAAVDAYVTSLPGEATRSRNLPDARFRRVGVGVVEGASRRFGAGRLFVVVVYTD